MPLQRQNPKNFYVMCIGDNSNVIGLAKKYFKSHFDITVSNSFFFNSILYKQIEGLGMRQPLPIFLCAFMKRSGWNNAQMI